METSWGNSRASRLLIIPAIHSASPGLACLRQLHVAPPTSGRGPARRAPSARVRSSRGRAEPWARSGPQCACAEGATVRGGVEPEELRLR